MAHNFLVQPGRWNLEGYWLEKNISLPIQGRTMIVWDKGNWFTMVTKLVFPNSERKEISLQYRGRVDNEARQYSYLLQSSLLGKVEGEGWIGPSSIIQRYLVLGENQRVSGFETFYQVNKEKYHFSSGIMTGHLLNSTMEGILERQS